MQIEKEKAIRGYCGKNPVIIYGDYQDELSNDLIDCLLESPDKFWESACESEFQIQDSWYEYGFEDYKKEVFEACGIEEDETDSDTLESYEETIRYNFFFDFSDYWRTACQNTRVHITLEPINPETEEPFYCVHWGLDWHENMSRARALMKYFGIRNYRAIESMYAHETLKICGTLDLWDLAEKQKAPDSFRIHSGDNMLFHTAWNGSGCLGDVKMRKDSVVIKCTVRNDSNSKYGVDAVYGFTSRYWQEELTPIWNEEPESMAT